MIAANFDPRHDLHKWELPVLAEVVAGLACLATPAQGRRLVLARAAGVQGQAKKTRDNSDGRRGVRDRLRVWSGREGARVGNASKRGCQRGLERVVLERVFGTGYTGR